MQEEQTVSFQPISYDGPEPWYVNLFLIYLLCMLLMTVGRAVRLMWVLRKHGKAQRREVPPESSSQSVWELCNSEIRTIRNSSHLNFLLATIVLSWHAVEILAGVATEKVASLPYVAGRLADAIVPFSMGAIICSVQFSCAMLLEGRVRRERLLLDRKVSKQQLPGE